MADKASLLWLDLEMTGLEPEKDRIIEVAAIATDWNFKEIAMFDEVVFQPPEVVNAMDEWAKQHHAESGLTAKIPAGKSEENVEQSLLDMIATHFGSEVYLAGNSIHQDRRFVRTYWPQLDKKLHYRMLDVSAWKVVMSHKFDVTFHKTEQHRALEDIRGSIEELKLYLHYFKKSDSAGESVAKVE